MIEGDLRAFLISELVSTPVYCELPENLPAKLVAIDRHGGGVKNRLNSALFTIQSYGGTLAEAAALNEKVKAAMLGDSCPWGVRLNMDGNFPDLRRNRNRYQAVYEIYY